MKPKINLEISKDLQFSLSTKANTKALQEIWPSVTFRMMGDPNSFSFVRGDVTRKLFRAGCHTKTGDLTQTYEWVYGWGSDFKAFQGYPVYFRSGWHYKMSDSTWLNAQGIADSAYFLRTTVSHKWDKNWTISATQEFDSSSLGKPIGPYHVGFAASYRL